MRKRPIKPPTPESLAKSALHYLGRFAASEASLRRVLENRIRRAALRNREFAADQVTQQALRHSIDGIIARHKKSGALNDATFAQTKINSLRRAGRSACAIRQKLSHAGVGREIVENALAGNEDGLDADEIEIKAALALARRRRLGPFRKGNARDPELYRKDLASLARAGFSLAIARRVLNDQGLDDGAGAGEGFAGFSAK